jgi:TonB-linked SusC/RagA family outer membrane protein
VVATLPAKFLVINNTIIRECSLFNQKNKVMFLKILSVRSKQNLTKTLLIMKLTAILILMACLQVTAKSYSQKVTLSMRDAPLQKVFKEIQKQTGYNFLYPYELLEKAGKVDVKIYNAPLQEALQQCLQKTTLTYSIVDKTIVIKEKEAEKTVSNPATVSTIPLMIISGKVTDENGKPLQGVSVLIKGSSLGTNTNVNGEFSIDVPDNSSKVLVFSFVGMETQEVNVSGKTTITVTLQNNNQQQKEIVVVGYSEKSKSALTSAVSVVSGDKLRDVTSSNIGDMLQGKVAGLQVVNSSGVPGAVPEIRLRGISSVNASQSPLFVVDGIIGGNFDPNDVESVTVLKDAGATAMYGSQANAGVIIVTTKKGRPGKTNYEAKITTGFRTPDFGKMQMMNGSELYNYQKQFYRDYVPSDSGNSYKIDILKFYDERPLTLRDQNYNWLTTIFKPAFMQNYYFSLAGKTEKNDYYMGVSYYDEKGTFRNTDFKRLNMRVNSTYRFNPKISLTNNINLDVSEGKTYDYNDIYYAFLNLPWDNPFDSSGNARYVDGNSPFKWWSRDKINPLNTIDNSNHPYKGADLNYDLNLNINLTHWLTFSSSNRIAAAYNKSTNYYSPTVAGQYHGTGFLEEQSILNYGFISNELLKFKVKKGKSSFNGLAGFAVQASNTETLGASGKGLPQGLNVLNVVSNNILVNGNNDKSMIQSFISQLSYDYENKYFLTGSYRVDGSSAFPSSKRYASFPAISAAWLASNESFFNSKSIDLLKFRVSYGVTGTQDIGASRYLGLYSLTSQYNSQGAATPLQLASPNLTWESKYQANAGIDLSLFKRIDLTVDVYNNVTKNLLLQVSQPLSVGFEQRWENVGQIVNNGVEINLNTMNIQGSNFQWNTGFNINFNTNKLRQLPSDIIKTGSWAISQIYRNGGNLYEFYMPVWAGVDKQTGAPLWEKVSQDAQGNPTGKTTTSKYADATYQEVGSALPKFQGGFTNQFTFKNISLSVNAYFLSGNKVFSNDLRFVMNDGSDPYMNQAVLPKGYNIWTKPGDVATNPSPQNSANSTETSTRYLKDGSFISIRNITLSYKLPVALIQRLKVNGIVVSLSADNVYTFSNFFGQDPQTTITPAAFVTPGVSDFKYPNNRQFLFNIDFKF